MPLEKSIRDMLLENRLGPGAGPKEETPALQGSSQKAQFGTMQHGNSKIEGGVNELKPGAGTKEDKPHKQGSSKDAEKEELDKEAPGKTAAARMKESGRKPKTQGAGKAINFSDVADPRSVVMQPNSRGNIAQEGVEHDEEDLLDDDVDLEDLDWDDEDLEELQDAVDEIVAELGEELDLSEEQLQELSNKTMVSYIKKATKSRDRLDSKGEKEEDKAMSTDGNKYPAKQDRHNANAKKLYRKANRRHLGIQRASKKLQRASKKLAKEDLDQSVAAIFSGEGMELTEEFKTKASELFETVVNARVADLVEEIQEEIIEEANEAIEEIEAELVEQLDQYLSYVANKWLEDNIVEADAGLRTEVTESFMDGLRHLFAEHNIEVPETENVLDEIEDEIEELKAQLNDKIDEAVSLSAENLMLRRNAVLTQVCENLTKTDAEKLRSLTENVDFDGEESFAEKVKVIKESYFGKPNRPKVEKLDEETTQETELSGDIAKYAHAIAKQVRL